MFPSHSQGGGVGEGAPRLPARLPDYFVKCHKPPPTVISSRCEDGQHGLAAARHRLGDVPRIVLADLGGRLGGRLVFTCCQAGPARGVSASPQLDCDARTNEAERSEHAGQRAGAHTAGNGQNAWQRVWCRSWNLREDWWLGASHRYLTSGARRG